MMNIPSLKTQVLKPYNLTLVLSVCAKIDLSFTGPPLSPHGIEAV